MTPEEIRKHREAAQVLLTLLRCISMKKALQADSGDRLNFFRLYDGCLMDEAVISWSKLFGSPSEKLHWKKLFDEGEILLIKPQLASVLGSGTTLDDLSQEIRNYRDTYVAHHDLDEAKRAKNHLMLDPLRDTGVVIYKALFDRLESIGQSQALPRPAGISGGARERIEHHWKMIAAVARKATSHFDDAPREL